MVVFSFVVISLSFSTDFDSELGYGAALTGRAGWALAGTTQACAHRRSPTGCGTSANLLTVFRVQILQRFLFDLKLSAPGPAPDLALLLLLLLVISYVPSLSTFTMLGMLKSSQLGQYARRWATYLSLRPFFACRSRPSGSEMTGPPPKTAFPEPAFPPLGSFRGTRSSKGITPSFLLRSGFLSFFMTRNR